MPAPRPLLRLLCSLGLLVAGAGTGGCALDDPPAWEPPPSAAARADEPRDRRVAIADFEYGPRSVVVEPGARITWTNRDAANHTVTFKGEPGSLGNARRGDSLQVRLLRPGRYRYLCAYHPAMRGTVIVRR